MSFIFYIKITFFPHLYLLLASVEPPLMSATCPKQPFLYNGYFFWQTIHILTLFKALSTVQWQPFYNGHFLV